MIRHLLPLLVVEVALLIIELLRIRSHIILLRWAGILLRVDRRVFPESGLDLFEDHCLGVMEVGVYEGEVLDPVLRLRRRRRHFVRCRV